MSRTLLSLLIILSLLLCSCGKKQALLNTAITEKSEVVSELAKSQKELKEEKEKVIQVQEELEKANQRTQEGIDNLEFFFAFGFISGVLIWAGCVYCLSLR
ncbi:hypothetical protein AGMMS5026_10760 [Endomicrobiia bacterium]|nr:hypothetical protein AGMMS49523_10820 [Endomicrobiia bacterium]GHT14520.1 hypothetical protein AGMMS49571_10330 [Endomicrobiia bacterium]GHT14546.1 hypothetical protein AGMMS49571_10420 [Endomicrobiia bacterium]GHT29020.1 hypothetical protein AGMMS49995_10800 [Endomicrobiia bacterium]GHT32568.1 hypothetical protein AGMMS5026_10760 [Endomicrobiia bacterium]